MGSLKPRVYDSSHLKLLLAKSGLTVEDMVTCFQFEGWFFTHFISENQGDSQVPNPYWEDIVMCMLKQPTLRAFQQLNPNSSLGMYVVCGRLSDETSPEYIPSSPYFNWKALPLFVHTEGSPSAESKGEAVIKALTKHSKHIDMDQIYLAKNIRIIVQAKKWLIEPKNLEACTPFMNALNFFDTIVHNLHMEEKAKAEFEALAKRLARAKECKAEFDRKKAEMDAREKLSRTCIFCLDNFAFVLPLGQSAETYNPVIPDGELDMSTVCDTCQSILCQVCKLTVCLASKETEQWICSDCQGIKCTVCDKPATDPEGIKRKLCPPCYAVRVCPCGGDIPGYNYKFRLCLDCNKCKTCPNKKLDTPSEQTSQMCNACVVTCITPENDL